MISVGYIFVHKLAQLGIIYVFLQFFGQFVYFQQADQVEILDTFVS